MPCRAGAPCRPISIHAPREGGDYLAALRDGQILQISIHAPREGGDAAVIHFCPAIFNFNPRPPRGGRPASTPACAGTP